MSKISHDSETPAHGQQVFTACAFIWHDFGGVKKVFLAKRAASKKFYPNVYEMPGGHIDFGEDMKEGLAREVKEELGMTVNIGDPFYEFTYTNHIKGSHSIEIIYFAKFVEPIDQIKFDPEDYSEYGWFAVDQIDDLMKNDRKPEDTQECAAVKKGLALVSGTPLNFS
jgi:8-oxo-dGTP pyrophosphatase MutT (NUDIX family)